MGLTTEATNDTWHTLVRNRQGANLQEPREMLLILTAKVINQGDGQGQPPIDDIGSS